MANSRWELKKSTPLPQPVYPLYWFQPADGMFIDRGDGRGWIPLRETDIPKPPTCPTCGATSCLHGIPDAPWIHNGTYVPSYGGISREGYVGQKPAIPNTATVMNYVPSPCSKCGQIPFLCECPMWETPQDLALKAAHQRIVELEAEVEIDNQLLADRQKILDVCPCPIHGRCIPYVIERLELLNALEQQEKARAGQP